MARDGERRRWSTDLLFTDNCRGRCLPSCQQAASQETGTANRLSDFRGEAGVIDAIGIRPGCWGIALTVYFTNR